MKETREKYLDGQILLFNKPLGWTSFDLVKKVKNTLRRNLEIDKIKVGHAGTLDPLATGLLIVCTGRATKKIQQIQELGKEYIASIMLGKTTPSFDLETDFDKEFPTSHISKELIEKTIPRFIGETDQIPPAFSAKNIKGKRAYEYARKGETVELKPSRIRIDSIGVLNYSSLEVQLNIKCSKGTYIRSLARDIGEALNSGAYLSKLTRIQIGEYHIDNAMDPFDFEKKTEKTKQI